MGSTVSVSVGYGFKVPKEVIDRLEKLDVDMYDWLEEHADNDTLCWDMGYFDDHYEDEPYAVYVKRLTDQMYGTGVHDGPLHAIPNTLTQQEVDAVIAVWRAMDIKPEDVSMRWLTTVSVGH